MATLCHTPVLDKIQRETSEDPAWLGLVWLGLTRAHEDKHNKDAMGGARLAAIYKQRFESASNCFVRTGAKKVLLSAKTPRRSAREKLQKQILFMALATVRQTMLRNNFTN
jgi:hypothetical protein